MSAPTQLQLATLLATINLAALEAAIRDAQPGQPGGTNYDPRTTSGQGPADPTAAAALGGKDGKPHPAVDHLDRMLKSRDQYRQAVLTLVALSELYTPSHEPRRATLAAETRGCTWCQQAGITEHQPVWRTSDCGFLTQPVPLGRPCYEYAMAHGERPSNEQIIRHHRTGKWTQRLNPKARNFSVEQVADFRPGGTAA